MKCCAGKTAQQQRMRKGVGHLFSFNGCNRQFCHRAGAFLLRPCGCRPCCPPTKRQRLLIGITSIFDSHTSQKEDNKQVFRRRASAVGRAAGCDGRRRCPYARTARQKNLKFWTETHSENHALSLCAPFRPHPRCFPSKTPGRVFSLGTYSSLQAVRMLLKIRFRPQSR